MKLKALLLALAVAGAAAAFGLTDTGRSDTGTGSSTTTTTTTTTTSGGSDCKPFWLAGPLTSVGTTSFTLTPMHGPHASTQTADPVTVAITDDTRVFWQGRGSLAGPAAGDVASVFGKRCGTTSTARLVLVHPAPKAAPQGGAEPSHHRH